MHRIFFDSNAGSLEFGYLLHFERSISDLGKLGNELAEGTIVTIYDPDELEMEGVLVYDEEFGCWKAKPIKNSLRYL